MCISAVVTPCSFVSLCFGEVYNNDTPLHLACGNGMINLSRLLLSLGANPMCTNMLGETCLHSVAKSVYNLNCGIELLGLVAEWEDANNGECVSLQVTDANDNNLLHLASLAGNEALSSK